MNPPYGSEIDAWVEKAAASGTFAKAPHGVQFNLLEYPFEYPREWVIERNYSWNEVYAVRAFLMVLFYFSTISSDGFAVISLQERRQRCQQTMAAVCGSFADQTIQRNNQSTPVLGQTEKNSVRAHVFRFALKLRHRSTHLACLKGALRRDLERHNEGRCRKQTDYANPCIDFCTGIISPPTAETGATRTVIR